MKKWIVPLLIFVFVFAFNTSAFAASLYDEATTYVQFGDYRLVQTYGGSPKNNTPGYIVKMDDGRIGLLSYNLMTNGYEICNSSGTSRIQVTGADGPFYKVEDHQWASQNKYLWVADFPLTLGDQTFSSVDDFRTRSTGNNYMLVTSSVSDPNTDSELKDFFRIPLLETVQELQEGTVTATQIIKDSYLVYLVPCGIGLLALLTSLPVLKRGLSTFLH